MSTPTPTALQPPPSIISAQEPDAEQTIAGVLDQISEVILGKRRQASLALSCLLAGGHLLIEDIPGVGKTTLAQAFARVLGLEFSRIQFTSDLLPADAVGVTVYHAETATFRFQPGPVFAEVVLADELNRATPKAQSALLEAMGGEDIEALEWAIGRAREQGLHRASLKKAHGRLRDLRGRLRRGR